MMTLELGQLIYTNFPDHGLQSLSSTDVSEEVKQVFLAQVVRQYWQADATTQSGYRAAYLVQITAEQTLFGWMYNHGEDELERSHIPYFIAYYLTQKIDASLLESIYSCLERGPITFIERNNAVPVVDKVVIDNANLWQPALPGVTIPSGTRARCRLLLNKAKLLSFSVAVPGELEAVEEEEESLEYSLTAPITFSAEGDHQPLLSSLERLLDSPRMSGDTGMVPTAKTALLIGVSHCAMGFESLPGVQKDIAVMKQVLENPQIAGFDEVQVLLNPNPQVLAESLESLCQDRDVDDLLLVYFSGHGVILDDQGRFGLTTSKSRFNAQDKIVRSTLVSADLIQEILNECQAQRQIVVLDCCYHAPPAAMVAPVNLAHYLGDARRTILAAAVQSSQTLVYKGSGLSPYTFYLVEGLRTGAADQNCDGFITVEEWHTYAKYKVKQEIPALTLQLFNGKPCHNVVLAYSQSHDPRLIYRRQCEYYAGQGGISPVSRVILDNLRTSLDLDTDAANLIESEVSKPRHTYQTKLQEYAMAFVQAVRQDYPVNEFLQDQFSHFQATLGLTDADTLPVESAIIRQVQIIQAPEQALEVARVNVQNLPWKKQVEGQPFYGLETGQRYWQSSPNGLIFRGQNWFQTARRRLRRGPVLVSSRSFRPFQSVSRRVWWLAGVGAIALLILTTIFQLQQAIKQQKQETQQLRFWQSLAQQKRYQNCISQTQDISQESKLYSQAQQLYALCQMGINWKNAQQKTIQTSPKQTLRSLVLSPDGNNLMSSGDQNDIQIWSLGQGLLIRTLKAHKDKIWSIALDPDGEVLVSASGDSTIKLWDVPTGKLLKTLSDHPSTVWSVAISQDGKWLVSGSEDKTLKMWDIKTGKLVRTLTGHSSPVRSVAISPNSQWIASASGDKTIKLWDLKTGQLIRTLTGHTERVVSIAFSPQSQTLASASHDKTVKLWDLKAGKLHQTYTQHTQPVTAVTFSPDGLTLATGSQDRTVKLWNLATDEVRHTLSGYQGDIYSLTFALDGQSLISSGNNSEIKIWNRN